MSNPVIVPIAGNITTMFTFTDSIYSPDGRPLSVWLNIDSTIISVPETNDGLYSYSLTLSAGYHIFYFNCSDGILSNFSSAGAITIIGPPPVANSSVRIGVNGFCYTGRSILSSALLAQGDFQWIAIWNHTHFEYDFANRVGDEFIVERGAGFFVFSPTNGNLSLEVGWSDMTYNMTPGFNLVGNPTNDTINATILAGSNPNIVWVAVVHVDGNDYTFSYYYKDRPGPNGDLTIGARDIAWVFLTE